MKKITQCSLCDNFDLIPVFSVIDRLVSSETFDIIECISCKARHTSPVPSGNEVGRYYKSAEYHPHSVQGISISDIAYRIVRGIMIERKRKWIQKFSGLTTGRLLDIGCGTGEFPAFMRDNGWEVSCVDSSESVLKSVKERFGLNGLLSDLWLKMDTPPFDVITLWHTLEHVADPRLYLETAISQLTEKGTILIGVPNFTSYDAQIYGKYWAAYDAPRHFTHFHPSSMELFLESCHLNLSAIIGLTYDSYYVSILSAKNMGKITLGALWTGFISNQKARYNTKRSSSLIYVVRPEAID